MVLFGIWFIIILFILHVSIDQYLNYKRQCWGLTFVVPLKE